MSRVCQHCGESLEGRSLKAKYCSHPCKKRAEYLKNPVAHRRSVDLARQKHRQAYNDQKAIYRANNPEIGLAASRKHYRASAAADQVQQALIAIPAIMAKINEAQEQEK